jgi:hypothetical protein
MANCSGISVGFDPLTVIGGLPYQGLALGLYPSGSNDMPGAHLAAGMQQASEIVPRRPNGNPNANGKIGLVSIGPSNTKQEFETWAAGAPATNPAVVLVNGAQSGVIATEWANPANACWTALDALVEVAGLKPAQVQVAWVKLANPLRGGPWPAYKDLLQADTEAVLKLLATRFPNLKVAYLSSWVYGGYATIHPGDVDAEPAAYESGFAVRGLIERQLDGLLPYSGAERVAPWLAWGPYLWADGLTPRADGLIWECADYEVDDGQHPSPSGEAKVAAMLTSFFTSDPTATPWF